MEYTISPLTEMDTKTRQGTDLVREASTHKVTWPFDHVNVTGHVAN